MGTEKVASLTWEVVNAVMGKGGFMMRWRMGRRSLGVLALLLGALLTAFALSPSRRR